MRLFRLALLILCLALPGPSPAADDRSADGSDQDQAFSLGEVVVLGQRSAAERVAFGLRIDAELIKALGARNAAEALALDSGSRVDAAPTSISANGKQESLLSLRGFDPRDVAVLIDGIPVYEPYFHVLDLSRIPAGDIAAIQVSRGAGSVLYGPNSLAGAINIVTRRGVEQPSAHLDAGYGDVNAWRGAGRASGAWKGFDYYLAPAFSSSDGYLISSEMDKTTRNEDGGVRDNSDSQSLSLQGRAGYNNELGGLALTAGHYQFQGGVPFSMEAVDPATLWRKDWRKSTLALHGELAPADWLLLRSRLFYVRFFNTITTYEDADMSAVLSNGKAVSTYDNDVAGFVVVPEFRLGKLSTLSLSAIGKFDSVSIQENAGEQWRDYAAETYSGALEYGLNLDRLAATAGGAWHTFRRTKTPGDALGEDDQAFDGQIGLAVDPLEWLTLKAAFARKTAFPDLKTLYGSEGNPELDPEHAYNLDCGVNVAPLAGLTLEETYFQSWAYDLIGQRELGNTYTFENVDSAQINGLESVVRFAVLKGLISGGVSHTYMRTYDFRADRKLKSLDFRPEQRLAADGRLALDFGLAVAVQYLYTGERQYQEQGAELEVRSLPEYGLVNARISQTLKWRNNSTRLELYAEGKNLLDTYYEQSPLKAAPGRNLSVGLSLDF